MPDHHIRGAVVAPLREIIHALYYNAVAEARVPAEAKTPFAKKVWTDVDRLIIISAPAAGAKRGREEGAGAGRVGGTGEATEGN